MKWLADENVERPIIEHLRRTGLDVVSVAEELPSATDSKILDLANKEGRIILTNDKDFGELAFLGQRATKGIVLLRFKTEDSQLKIRFVARFLGKHGDDLDRKFVVLRESGARIKKLR